MKNPIEWNKHEDCFHDEVGSGWPIKHLDLFVIDNDEEDHQTHHRGGSCPGHPALPVNLQALILIETLELIPWMPVTFV